MSRRVPISRCQTAQHAAQLVPAAHRARVFELSPPPETEGWRSADTRPVLARHRWPAKDGSRAGALARRPGVPCDRDAAPLGAPSVAIFGLGSAFPAPAFPLEHVQPAPGSTGRSARRAVSEASRARGYESRDKV